MKVAINGMGRIGRLLFRRLYNDPSVELVAVNDIMEPDNLLYLLKYDSVYGTFPGELSLAPDHTIRGERPVKVLQNPQPITLPWKELGVDVVIECSGKFSSKAGAGEHLLAGARKVLLSTTGSEDIPLMIYGFNQAGILEDTDIISPGGCMTNCSVHILYILQAIGIRSAQLHFLHSYTSRQELVDAPHKQFRRGRAAAESIIPVEIDLHHSLERLMPGMKGKILSLSTRIPVANGAMADFTIQLDREVSVAEVNRLFRVAAAGEYKGILDYSEEEMVSLDYKGNTHSCVIDGTLTSVVGNHLKLIAWFDNEYGFTSRMIDWLYYWKAHSFR
ncbi:MAG: type I glyceraldehyde-3-phosphate dehydrogenase [Chitinophagaceae bacterium]|nr:MAG: type I glyceraldehyde-3-phosphate dehydrogenase [Chitinophagaceae bacterium]